jgi:BioD-like phosphotransacetylase family protein
MRPLFLSSVFENSGKSMVALGLAKNFKGKVGYYKPFREDVLCIDNRVVDRDAYLMKKALDLEYSEEMLSPLKYDIFSPVSMEAITTGYERVKGDADFMVVESAQLFTTGALHRVEGVSIAQAIGAEIVLVATSEPDALDKVAHHARLMEKAGIKLKGVILNKSDDPAVERLLEGAGVRVLGSIPVARDLGYLHVSEIAEALNAEVLAGEEGLERTIEKTMVGGMTAESAMKDMRRLPKKAMIAGGDRADMLTAALATDTSCLILTGGLYPARQILAKADELKVPVLLVGHSTAVTAEMVDRLIARINPNDVDKIEHIADLVRRHVNLEAIWGD